MRHGDKAGEKRKGKGRQEEGKRKRGRHRLPSFGGRTCVVHVLVDVATATLLSRAGVLKAPVAHKKDEALEGLDVCVGVAVVDTRADGGEVVHALVEDRRRNVRGGGEGIEWRTAKRARPGAVTVLRSSHPECHRSGST